MTIKTTQGDQYLLVSLSDTYGGQILNVMHTAHFVDLMNWLELFKENEIRERLIRENNPEVKLAYDAYKMSIAMHST